MIPNAAPLPWTTTEYPPRAAALKLIVVESHEQRRVATVAALCRMGHIARGVTSARALEHELADFPAELLVLDRKLPDEDGLHLAQRLRAAQPDIRIILLSTDTRLDEKLAAYQCGADLFLSKPASMEELSAAIGALSRRIPSQSCAPFQLTLNPSTMHLHGLCGVAEVSGTETILLTAFAAATDHRLSIRQMLDLTGRSAVTTRKATLEVQIVRLRKKLEQVGAPSPTLKAIRGVGYQLCVPLLIKPPPTANPSP